MTENLKEIYVNITYKSYSIENPMYKIPLSPAGGLLCTVRLILKYNSVRDIYNTFLSILDLPLPYVTPTHSI